MKKSSVLLICLFLVVVTAVSTYAVTTNVVALCNANAAFSSDQGAGLIASTRDSGAKPVVTNRDGQVLLDRAEYDQLLNLRERYKDLEELQEIISEMYYKEVTPELLMEGAKKGVFSVLGDPYSVFMNPQEYTSFEESISGEFPGIGVYVSPNPDRGIEIISPIEDTPAYAAGLQALDIIKAVNGVEYTHNEMDEAIKNIRGEIGTKVTITIYRPSTNETFDVTITRALIVVKVVKSEMLENGIGYLRLTQFDSHASKEFYQHMESLVKQGAKGVIVDLRDNPGGNLNECLNICDMLLPRQLICSTKGRTPGSNEEFMSDAKQYNVKLVLLINQGSASASEILAGAIKDNKRGLLVGSKSFGKGVVQTFMPYKNGTGLKITTSEYFTPSGINIHGIGIAPDVEVVLSEHYKTIKNPTHKDDNQLQEALKQLKKMMK